MRGRMGQNAEGLAGYEDSEFILMDGEVLRVLCRRET